MTIIVALGSNLLERDWARKVKQGSCPGAGCDNQWDSFALWPQALEGGYPFQVQLDCRK